MHIYVHLSLTLQCNTYTTNTSYLGVNLRSFLFPFSFILCSFLLSFLVPIYGSSMKGIPVEKKEFLRNSLSKGIPVPFWPQKQELEKEHTPQMRKFWRQSWNQEITNPRFFISRILSLVIETKSLVNTRVYVKTEGFQYIYLSMPQVTNANEGLKIVMESRKNKIRDFITSD